MGLVIYIRSRGVCASHLSCRSAFGGMVAFCVIVGDTSPHVLTAVFPSLPTSSVLWVFSDRRFIIVLFVVGISYPLALYRDIAKVPLLRPNSLAVSNFFHGSEPSDVIQLAKASTLALISMLVIIIAIITQGARLPVDLRGSFTSLLFFEEGIFQAIGIISFGKAHVSISGLSGVLTCVV
jgi:solute carrier family 38 (sodium-coupled neutral amino acid transporter), member 11